MVRSSLGRAIDNFVICILLTLVGFIIYKQFVAKSIVALCLSVLTSTLFLYIIISVQNRKLEKLSIKKSELKMVEKYNYELRKLGFSEQIKFFMNLLKSKNPTLVDGLILTDDKLLIMIKLDTDCISESDVFKIYALSKKFETCERIIVCNDASEKAIALANSADLKATILSPLETYALMKKYNYFLPCDLTESKVKRFMPIRNSFMKKRARIFIRIGLMLYFLALFVPFSKYYIISAGVCLIIAIVFLLFGKRQPKQQPSKLL